ncbi:hypothetical protein Btru_047233 [Bulinus truncatus]|nr:hypothetical protein Btru_047233 [Bulinus truncatus]
MLEFNTQQKTDGFFLIYLVTITTRAEIVVSGRLPQTHTVTCTIYMEDLMQWPNVLKNCSDLNATLSTRVKELISIGINTSDLGALCINCGQHGTHGTFYPSRSLGALGRLIAEDGTAQEVGPNQLCVDGWMRYDHVGSTDETNVSARICIISENLYYFGDKLQFLCHCQWGECRENSDCLMDNWTMCSKGWFGTKCQYRDLAQMSLIQTKQLTDSDDRTCLLVTPPQLTYIFRSPVFFTWVRLVQKQIDDQRTDVSSKIRIQLLQDKTLVECGGQRQIHLDKRTVDIHCSGIRVTEVRLSWKDNISLCSVYISGGKNVALRQSTQVADVKAEMTVDGNTGVFSPCYDSNASSFSLTVEFFKPKLVHEVVVYLSKDSIDRHFLVKLIGLRNQDLYLQTYTGNREPRHEIRLQTKTQLVLQKILISSNDGPSSLSLCEVEVFGDCASPNYGLGCGSMCSVRCLDRMCDHGGRCLACDGDWEGDNCQEPSQQVQVESSRLCHCTACDSRDWCLPDADCSRGWFGDHCELKDLAIESSMDEMLLDNQESTCYTPGNNQVVAEFRKEVLFHWVRLVFSSEVDHIDLMLFKTKDVNEPPSACERKRITVTAESSSMRVYTINCGAHHLVRAVRVRWSGRTPLCTLHMYGGSNLAIIANAKMTNTSDEEFSLSGSSSTDGLVGQHSGCLELDGDNNLFLSMSFPAEVMVFNILLYSTRLNKTDSLEDPSDSNILEVNSLDTRNDVVDSKIVAIQHDGVITLTSFPHYGVTRINFLMIKGQLSVCEVEVFGECMPPAFGLRCEKTCSPSCYHRQCYQDGICWQCRDGVSGKVCTEKEGFNAMTMPKLIEHMAAAMPEAKKGSDIMNFIIACLIVISCIWVFLFRYQNRNEPKR